MYQKPDFVKVSLKVSDIFANYGTTGCPEEEGGYWTKTYPCENSSDGVYNQGTFTGLGLAHQCYLIDRA